MTDYSLDYLSFIFISKSKIVMEIISNLFDMAPFVALFITLSLGYMVGKITIGRFVLGGVAGTLLMGVIIGNLVFILIPA